MYALLKYDLYPYVLCAKVTEGPFDDGKVCLKGYGVGKGFSRTPWQLLPEDIGKKFKAQLEYETARYREIQKQARQRGIARLSKIHNYRI